MIQQVTGVLSLGNICYDIPVWPVDRFEWGTTTWVDQLSGGVGGNAGNTAYAAAKLGCPSKVLGMVGQDWQGDQLMRLLADVGVDLTAVQRTTSPTNSTVCLVNSSGDRMFLHRLGASSDVRADSIRFDGVQTYSHFHVANVFTLPDIRRNGEAVVKAARAAGKTVSLDTGWDALGHWMRDVQPCLPYVDLLFVNEPEARMLTGLDDVAAAAASLRRLGAREVIVKLGPGGSMLLTETDRMMEPGFSVSQVDTTGAGDCFAGGFLAALHHGLSYREALRFANAVGALNVQKLGAVTGILGFAETSEWMKSKQQSNGRLH